MKRAREDTTSANEQSQAKKRKVEHRLHHTQPVERIVEPLSGSFGVSGDSRFVDHQVRRAIAISCKSIGFDGAEPHAIESFHGLVDRCMVCPHFPRQSWLVYLRKLTGHRHEYPSCRRSEVYDQRSSH